MTISRSLILESLLRTIRVLPVFEDGAARIVISLLREVESLPEAFFLSTSFAKALRPRKPKKVSEPGRALPTPPRAKPLLEKLRKAPLEVTYDEEDPDPPDPVLDQARQAEGSRALLLEIIRRAAYDWVLYRGSSRIDQKQLAEEAYVWLFVEGPDHPHWAIREKEGKTLTSLVTICDELELSVDTVREHVRSLTPNKVMSSGRPPESSRSGDYSMRVEVHTTIPGIDDDTSFDFESLLVTGFDFE